MDENGLPLWIKWFMGATGGAFAWWLVFVLSKTWVQDNVIEPIKDLKRSQGELRSNFITFTERVNSMVFELMKQNKDQSVHQTKLLEQVTLDARQAINNSGNAVERADATEKMTKKIYEIAATLHEKHQHLRTEVTQLSKDMIMVKGKIQDEN